MCLRPKLQAFQLPSVFCLWNFTSFFDFQMLQLQMALLHLLQKLQRNLKKRTLICLLPQFHRPLLLQPTLFSSLPLKLSGLGTHNLWRESWLMTHTSKLWLLAMMVQSDYTTQVAQNCKGLFPSANSMLCSSDYSFHYFLGSNQSPILCIS